MKEISTEAEVLNLKPCPFCGAKTESLLGLVKHKCPKERSIELDCPPGSPRPGDLIEGVIAGLGLPSKEPVSRIFGCWRWEYPEISWERWTEIQPTLQSRIKKLLMKGTIRYGSW